MTTAPQKASTTASSTAPTTTAATTASAWAVAGAIGLAAFVVEQVSHEVCHGVVALLVGGRWEWLHLFAVSTDVPPGASLAARIAVPASAALLNVAVGAIAVVMYPRVTRAELRLFLMYTAAFHLLAGFGYLLFDAMLFDPAAEAVGDWKKVLSLVGGGTLPRVAVGTIGFAGYLGAFFWLPRALTRFDVVGAPSRAAALRALAWAPFLAANGVATALAMLHPLEGAGVILVLSKGWMGFSAFFWAALMAREKPVHPAASIIGERTLVAPIAAALAIAVAVVLALGPWGPGAP